jgi:hypothetical protein
VGAVGWWALRGVLWAGGLLEGAARGCCGLLSVGAEVSGSCEFECACGDLAVMLGI